MERPPGFTDDPFCFGVVPTIKKEKRKCVLSSQPFYLWGYLILGAISLGFRSELIATNKPCAAVGLCAFHDEFFTMLS